MSFEPPSPPGRDGRVTDRTPLAGMRWSLESPDDHWEAHDRMQVRYWSSMPVADRLAQAERYRVRVFGAGPFALPRRFELLPSVIPPGDR